ncbi:MAG: hypothetical protein R3290_04075 [Acidimicrobiia bacterium]|nr:hypothetical protein [Acidimicrobiia bacterium]
MDAHEPTDPYRTCESHCNHDLARGIGIAELLGSDGPYPPSHLIVSLSYPRASLFDDEEQEIVAPAREAR